MSLGRRIGGSVLLVGLLCAPMACRTSRFPTCDTDAECVEREEGKVKRFCVNVRCVECRVDSDCDKPNHVCNRRTNECESLDT